MEGTTTLAPAATNADALIQALTAERDQARATAATLEDRLAVAESTCERVRAELAQLRSDVAHDVDRLSDRLIDEADRRGWCEQYDEIIEDVNTHMRCIAIRTRQQDYEIEVAITGTMTIHKTVTVNARNRDEAFERFREYPESYFNVEEGLLDAAQRNGFNNIEIDEE